MQNRKTIIYDIETTTNNVETFDTYREGYPVSEERHWIVFSISYKELGSKKTIVKGLPDFPRFKKNKLDDKDLITWFHKVLKDNVDITVSYNGDNFDVKRLNTRFAYHGLDPVLDQLRNIDPIKIVRKQFSVNSKSLDYVCRYFGLGGKYKGDKKYYTLDKKALWIGVVKGDIDAYKILKKYNLVDVEKLEALYVFLRKWIFSKSPEWNKKKQCPFCGGYNTQSRGSGPYKGRRHKRHECMDCAVDINKEHSWFYGDKIINKPTYAHT